MADIKKALRVALAQRKMTQTELAEKLQVSRAQVNMWVTSNRDMHSKTLNRIAEVLEISTSELIALGE